MSANSDENLLSTGSALLSLPQESVNNEILTQIRFSTGESPAERRLLLYSKKTFTSAITWQRILQNRFGQISYAVYTKL